MILGGLLAKSTDAECWALRRAEKKLDVNFDGVMELVGVANDCGDGYYFLDFGTAPAARFSFRAEEDLKTGTLIFRTGMELGFKAALRPGAAPLSVGEPVRLLDGRKGEVQGFTFILDKDYQYQDTRAEVMIEGAKTLIDVSLLDIISRKK